MNIENCLLVIKIEVIKRDVEVYFFVKIEYVVYKDNGSFFMFFYKRFSIVEFEFVWFIIYYNIIGVFLIVYFVFISFNDRWYLSILFGVICEIRYEVYL